MKKSRFRKSVWAGLIALSISGVTQASDFSVPAGDLGPALDAYIRQSGVQLIYRVEEVKGLQTAGVDGALSADAALAQLLAGTDLQVTRDESGAMAVGRAPVAVEGGSADPKAESPAAIDPALVDPGVATEPTTESVTSARRGGIEEIIVTARKREESIQDVPISITALSAEDMKVFGIRNVADMEGIVPGLNMGGGGNGVKKDSNPFIRGVGQRETKVTLDPGVGTYIDGIYIARTAGAMFDVAGVERVEVLRGPQGTLFGRNVTGGAISITTKKPTNDWSLEIGSNVGNYGRSDALMVVNAPIIKDSLLTRLTLATVNSEGYFTNIVDNTKWGDDNRITGLGQVRWLATDDLTFDLLGERTRIRETPRPQKCARARTLNSAEGYNDPTHPNYDPNPLGSAPLSYIDQIRRSRGELDFSTLCAQSAALPNNQFGSEYAEGSQLFDRGRYWVDTATAGLTATWDIGDLGPLSDTQFKSISAWRRVEQIADEDLDAVGATYLIRIQPHFDKTDQYSQELQLTGSALDKRLFFSTGLYYFDEETPANDLYRAAGLDYGRRNAADTWWQIRTNEATWERLETDNQSMAWFGQVDFNLTPQWQITAGLRYTQEERWARYSKGNVMLSSIVENMDLLGFSGGTFTDAPCTTACFFGTSTRPIFSPVDQWIFEGNRPGGASDPARPVPSSEDSVRDEAWTPMVSFKYQADDVLLDRLSLNSAMAYFTYSQGFHSGGVTAGAVDNDSPGRRDTNVPADTGIPCPNGAASCRITMFTDPGWGAEDVITFKPEKVKNYELGLKLQGLDRRVQANLAVFYMDYTDMQITSTASRAGLPIPFVDNVGKSVIQGVEAEFVFMPTPSWRVMLNAAYTDADMKEWNALKIVLNNANGNVTGVTTEVRDDEPMPRVPEWQGFLMTDYSFRLPGGSILAPSIAARYTSEIYHGFDRGSYVYAEDLVTSDKVTFIDARIPWISADGRLEVAAWVKNLTDIDDYLVGGIPLVDVTGAMGQVYANPRTFGLNMNYRFGM